MDIKQFIPRKIKTKLGPVYRRFVPYPSPDKHTSELNFWKSEYQKENGIFENGWYKKDMLAIAGENTAEFVRGKVVADFGCGPRGSLTWAASARERIGIDVLADIYKQNFDLSGHLMWYVVSTEESIPLPTHSVDILFTLNAMDHVVNFSTICRELLRILRPGGELVASFNLNEPATSTEPQCLTEDLVKAYFLGALRIKSYRLAPRGDSSSIYSRCFDGSIAKEGEESVLWVRAAKY